jgi:hypothetical protein
VRLCPQIRAVLVTLVVFAFPCRTVIAGPAQSESDFYNALLRMKLPIEKQNAAYVGYRYSHAPVPGDLEYSFVIDVGGDEQPISADVHMAEGTSIYEQMSALRKKNPKEDTGSVIKKLKVRSFHLTEQQCPTIRQEFEKFGNLQFPAPRFDFVSLDIPNQEIRIASSTGDMTFEWLDGRYPLVTWAQEMKQSLETCISSDLKINGPKN